MSRKYKVRRYEYEWGGQRKLWWKKALTVVLIVAAAGAVGWFGYEPVYQLVVNGIGGRLEPAPESTITPTPEPAPPASSQQPAAAAPVQGVIGLPTKLYYLPTATLGNAAGLTRALEQIKKLGGTGAAFDLKDDKGLVRYQSALPEVAAAFAQGEAPYNLATVIKTIEDAGLTPVGRLYAFRDSTATSSVALNAGAVKYLDSKVNWLDNAKADGGKAWLNANSALSRDYILKLVEETTGLGLDCVILDGVQFPTGLSLNLATYGGTPNRSAVLADFVAAAKGAADKNGAVICPVIGLDAAAGINNTPYGDAPQKLAAAAGHALLDVRPEQFGNGVTTEGLTLAKPMETPYDTVKTALTAAEGTLALEGVTFVAMVQQYTSTVGETPVPYGAAEAGQQARAAEEAGIGRIFYYNPSGSY